METGSTKRVVSVSLGSAKRNKTVEADLLGQHFIIERTNALDLEDGVRKISALDGKVDAIGLGGIDLYLIAGEHKYVVRDARKLASAAKITPIVDGSGLKNTLERETINYLVKNELLHPQQAMKGVNKLRVLVVSAVDRFGMAEGVAALGCRVLYGDFIFALGIPLPVRSIGMIRLLARTLLPIICRQPYERLYPLGEKQDTIEPKYGKYYEWADVIAGDFHLIRKHMPAVPTDPEAPLPLAGKCIVTNTTTEENVAELRARGLARLVTSTPVFDGRSFGTNVMEGVLVTLLGKKPEELTPEDYFAKLQEIGWQPQVQDL
jgi:hypothetical protein